MSDQIDFEQKFYKYATKKRRVLEQLGKHGFIDEQEVKYIGIEISNSSTNEEDSMMTAIINERRDGKFNILKTLWYIKNGYLKYKEIKKYHRNFRSTAEKKHEQLSDQLDNIMRSIRGNNTILNFDLCYIDRRVEYDVTKKGNNKMIYILEILPPEEENAHNFSDYQTLSDTELYWDSDDHDNVNTLKYKWLSGNHSWKWDSNKKVWLTNSARPWYFANFPSQLYTKSISEWNNTLTEVIQQEKMKQQYLNARRLKEEALKKKESDSWIGQFKNFFSKKSKVYITNNIDDDSYGTEDTKDLTL